MSPRQKWCRFLLKCEKYKVMIKWHILQKLTFVNFHTYIHTDLKIVFIMIV